MLIETLRRNAKSREECGTGEGLGRVSEKPSASTRMSKDMLYKNICISLEILLRVSSSIRMKGAWCVYVCVCVSILAGLHKVSGRECPEMRN